MKKRLAAVILTLAMLCGVLMTGAAASDDLPFTDVKKGSWYYDAVSYAYFRNIMTGVSDREFDPNGGMNRAMFVTVLGRLCGGKQVQTDSFPDVEADSWYGGWVGWAVGAGLVNGFEDGTFRPFSRITRAEMATLMARYISFSKIIPTHSWGADFTDKDAIPRWAAEFAEEMRLAGLVAGDENGRFNAGGNLTRAEAATVIRRLCEMTDDLAVGEPVRPSYVVADGVCFLDGTKLYYSGTALTSDCSGVSLGRSDDGSYYVAGSDGERSALYNDQTRWLQYLVGAQNSIADGHYLGIDLRALGISPAEYPAIRIGYRTAGDAEVRFGVYAVTTNSTGAVTSNDSRIIEIEPRTEDGGRNYFTVDLSGVGIPDTSTEVTLTVMTDGDGLELFYLGAYRSLAAADAADPSEYIGNGITPAVRYIPNVSQTKEEELNSICDERRDGILNSENITNPDDISGSCYYISSFRGDDSNDGRSPDTPWRSLSKLWRSIPNGEEISALKSGDAVFFERGSVFYGERGTRSSGNGVLACAPGVTYAAYGEGDKPLFTNALDVNGSRGWVETGYPNVYRLVDPFRVPDTAEDKGYCDVGSISVNGGEMWGVKVTVQDPYRPYSVKEGGGAEAYTSMTVDCGTVTNGRNVYREEAREFTDPGCLKNELEYFHDWNDNSLYLYCSAGNPGEVFDSVVVSQRGSGIGVASGVTLENLAVKYTGAHGMTSSEGRDIIVRFCDIEWVGGSVQGGTMRYGNAYENWGSCDGILVENCYVNQCYDTGVSTQGNNGRMVNMSVSDCVIERCTMAVEFFNSEADPAADNIMTNIFVENNCMRYCGYGFGCGRSDKKGTFFEGSNWSRGKSIFNVRFAHNLCLYAADYCFSEDSVACGDRAPGVAFYENQYLVYSGSYLARSAANIADRAGNNYTYYPYTLRYIEQLAALGIEKGSYFYSYDCPIDELESGGYYGTPIDR